MIALNTGFLFTDRPFLERIVLAARHGFDAVEFHGEAQEHDLGDVRAALREAKLPLLGLNVAAGETGGSAALPGEEVRARSEIDRAIETARELGGRAVHVLAGRTEPSEAAWATYRANLVHAADAAPDLAVLVEPLSPVAVPGYLVSTVAEAASVILFADRPNVRMMLDVYHVHQTAGTMEDADATGSVERALADYARFVGHVQISDPVTRHEPSAALLRTIRRAGWAGPVGAEYVPRGRVADGLGWMREGAR